MSSLYDIRQELLDCVDTETGEITDTARFDDLQIEYEEKVEGIALWIKTLNADAEAYKNEKNAFAERAKKAINEELERQGITAPAAKKAKLVSIINKSTIDTIDDANKVMDNLEGVQ